MLGTCWNCEAMTWPDQEGLCPECGEGVDIDPIPMAQSLYNPDRYDVAEDDYSEESFA